MSIRCQDCPANGRCDRCRELNRVQRRLERARRRRHEQMPIGPARVIAVEIIRLATAGRGRDPHLLPDDGLIDELAVRVAIHGERDVDLTYSERVAAATKIIQRRGTVRMVCHRLALPHIVTEEECRTSPVTELRNFAGYVD